MAPPRCAACGAPADPTRVVCGACGTPTSSAELLVAPTFGGPHGWRCHEQHPPPLVALNLSGPRLSVLVEPAPPQGPVQTAVAWLGGAFVDVQVGVTLRFGGDPVGAAAGWWLRSAGGDAVLLLLWDNGRITLSTHRGNQHHASLATLDPPSWVPGSAVRLHASLRGPTLSVRRDGRLVASLAVDRVAAGDAELRVQGGSRATGVELSEPMAMV